MVIIKKKDIQEQLFDLLQLSIVADDKKELGGESSITYRIRILKEILDNLPENTNISIDY